MSGVDGWMDTPLAVTTTGAPAVLKIVYLHQSKSIVVVTIPWLVAIPVIHSNSILCLLKGNTKSKKIV